MPASVVEVLPFAVAPYATQSVTVTTTLVSSDVVAVLYQQDAGGARNLVVTGYGLTDWPATIWYAQYDIMVLKMRTGLTGSEQIDLTASATTRNGAIFIIRGLDQPLVDLYSGFTDISFISPGVQVSASNGVTMNARNNQLILAAVKPRSGTATPATTSSTPNSGWTTSGPSSSFAWAWQTSAAATTLPFNAYVSGTANDMLDRIQLMFGRPTEHRIATTYAEAVTTTSPDARVASAYAESATSSIPDAIVAGMYLESATASNPDARIVNAYIEVATPALLAQTAFKGWGQSL